MTIQEGPGGKGTKILSNKYPAVEGLTGATTKQTKDRKLEPTSKSYLRKIESTGL